RAWQDNGLVFTTKTGRPVEPRNLVRSFHRICTAHGLRDIKVHHLRHTTATLLKMSGVASDASFGGSRERPRPATQRAAPGQTGSEEGTWSRGELGCDHPVAPNRTMRQPVRLQRIPA